MIEWGDMFELIEKCITRVADVRDVRGKVEMPRTSSEKIELESDRK